MEIKNLTPHDLNMSLPTGEIITIPPSGIVPRVNFARAPSQNTSLPLPVTRPLRGEIQNLPEPEAGVFLFVSAMIRGATQRYDLISPSSIPEDIIRNDKGQITAIKAFDGNW